jgi:tetratricopeptide (TPR) repeat protein
MTIEDGQQLLHYRLIERIGEGGMGVVWKAEDTKLSREVAVKVLSAALVGDPECRQRFQREARAAAALRHPNIVTIHSVEEVDGVQFLTMELIDGRILSEITPPGGFPLDEFLEVAKPLVDAVSCAHAGGITHRDLKPANIMVDSQGSLKVLDFGLAKLCAPVPRDDEETVLEVADITEPGSILGTVAYMSPEQVTGGEVDHRSDLFSLGVILYELLCGARPFQGDFFAETMRNIVHESPRPLSGLPESVTAVIGRCLEKAPERRYLDAGELRRALEALTPAPTSGAQDTPVASAATAAFARGDWEVAYAELHSIREQRNLSAEEMEMLGACASWLSKWDEWTRMLESAYAAYAKAGQDVAAAARVAGGWQRRAERLLRDAPACIEHGHLLRRQTVVELGRGALDRALEINEQCAAVADRFDDSELRTVALHDRGQILIARGDVEEGMDLVDEAMACAVSGEVDAETLGNLYCRTMTVCQSLADFIRVREWSEAASRWCEPHSSSGYPGVCQIRSAEALRQQGQWKEAEQAARSACEDFEKSGLNVHAGEAFYELGEIALNKGNWEEAERAFRQAHEFGHDPVPGLPLLRLVQGKSEAARQTIERALSENPQDRLRRALLLAAKSRIALANGDLVVAEEAAQELSELSKKFGCPVHRAQGLMGQGAVQLAREDAESAASALREAWSIFNELGLPYEAARTRVLLAKAYLQTGSLEDASLQFEAAVKTFGELGAQPDLEAVTEMIAASGQELAP